MINSNNNKNNWIRKNEECDYSEDSWINDSIDSNYLYVNNMNIRNKEVKSLEVVLAGLQSVIDMCTPADSVTDVNKCPLNHNDVQKCVEPEFMLLEKKLKDVKIKDQKENTTKRNKMPRSIKNIVKQNSQVNMKTRVTETVNKKNEIMMSFQHHQIVSINQNRLRGGVTKSSSHSVYSKCFQSHNAGDLKHKIKNSVIDNKHTSSNYTTKDSPDTTFTTDTTYINSTTSLTMKSKDTFSTFLTNNTTTKSTETENVLKLGSKNLKHYLSYLRTLCNESDALPLNTKVSTISTNNLKVIHISLGDNKQNTAEPLYFKSLRTKESGKNKMPRLVKGKSTKSVDTFKKSVHESIQNKKHLSQTNALFKVNQCRRRQNEQGYENIIDENSAYSDEDVTRTPSSKTVVISKTAFVKSDVNNQQCFAQKNNAFEDNPELKRQSKENHRTPGEDILGDTNETIKKKKSSLQSTNGKSSFIYLNNSFVNGSVKQKTPFSDLDKWLHDSSNIIKQTSGQLYQSQSDDSLNIRFTSLKVDSSKEFNAENEKTLAGQICQRKLAKRCNIAQLFGCSPQPCNCEECVKNRPIEIRYATTKISKFQHYSVFEIFKSSSNKPKFMNTATENIFVMKN